MALAAAAVDATPRWQDQPPTYERLLVDTLVDIRKNAHKHALLATSRRAPVSPCSPNSEVDLSSIHTDGTFDIDLKSIWSQKTAESTTVDGLSLASSSSSPHLRPRSPGDESFFPAPISPTSFLSYNDDDDDEDRYLDNDLPVLSSHFDHDTDEEDEDEDEDEDEPAPAYDAASSDATSTAASLHPPITRAMFTSQAVYTASSLSFSSFDASPQLSLPLPPPPPLPLPVTTSAATAAADEDEIEDEDDGEDPWTAFAAVCWAACVIDDPHNPPPHAFGRHTTFARLASSPSESERSPGPEHSSSPRRRRQRAYEPERERAQELSFGPRHSPLSVRYVPPFARTEPDLTVGVWSAGDNAVARALGLEDELDMDLNLDLDLDLDMDLEYAPDPRHHRRALSRAPGVAPSSPPAATSSSPRVVHRLEYIPARVPSPPRRFHKFAPADGEFVTTHKHAHARSNSGGLKRLWPWRGKENFAF